jgi:proteasome accessory factor C
VSSATEHLPRLLALVPWLLAHPDTRLADAAAEFGVSPAQLRDDLNLIWMCGLPGHGPGDLIDVFWTADRVTLANADTIARPLRLSSTETLVLVAALRALTALPGIADVSAAERALAKLEASAGSEAALGDRIAVASRQEGPAPGVAAAVREALTQGRRLRMDYWVPARDEVTHRDVDPLRVRSAEEATYLVGFCRLVEEIRTFRLDRILAAEILEVAAEIPDEAAGPPPDAALYVPDPSDRLVTFELDAAGRWVTDYYPVESIEDLAEGRVRVSLRARDEHWVRRLALSLAGRGRLTGPADLVEAVTAEARTALAGYG